MAAVFPSSIKSKIVKIREVVKREADKANNNKDILNVFLKGVQSEFKALYNTDAEGTSIIIDDTVKIPLRLENGKLKISNDVYISFIVDRDDIQKYRKSNRYKITPIGFSRYNIICEYNWSKLENTSLSTSETKQVNKFILLMGRYARTCAKYKENALVAFKDCAACSDNKLIINNMKRDSDGYKLDCKCILDTISIDFVSLLEFNGALNIPEEFIVNTDKYRYIIHMESEYTFTVKQKRS